MADNPNGAASGYALCVANFGSGLCDTLQVQGADDNQLALVGNGSIDPVLLMGELSGVAAAPYVSPTSPGTSVGETSSFVQSNPVSSSTSDLLLGGIQNTADSVGLGNVLSTGNLVLYGLIALAILLLVVWAYGGFKH
jgi:hypothetical protein